MTGEAFSTKYRFVYRFFDFIFSERFVTRHAQTRQLGPNQNGGNQAMGKMACFTIVLFDRLMNDSGLVFGSHFRMTFGTVAPDGRSFFLRRRHTA
jgi:hypothetical protein